MRKTLTHIMNLTGALLFCVLVTGCGKKESSKDARDKIIIATSADNPPYTFYNTSSGKRELQGFEIELARLIGEEMKVDIDFRDMDFSALIPSLQAGRADLIMALITPTKERLEKVDFSSIYSQSSPALLLKHQKPDLKEADLKGMRIGVQIASAHLELIKEIAGRVDDLEFVILNRVGDLVQELKSDRLDGVLAEETVVDSFLETNPELYKSRLEGHAVKAAAAFPKKSPWLEKFNAALAVLSKRGDLQKLAAKWTKSQ